MTTFRNLIKKCSVCGCENEFRLLMSSNAFGSRDLDTRPPQMLRSTLPYQIEICENCGYANNDIECEVSNRDREIVYSSDYKLILNNDEINNISKAFMLAGCIYSEYKKYKESGFLYLKAAWSCDDYRDRDNAIYFRKKSLELFDKYLSEVDDINIRVIRIDLLRRSLNFDLAIAQAEQLIKKIENDILKKILLYQIELSKLKDSSCHTVGEVYAI